MTLTAEHLTRRPRWERIRGPVLSAAAVAAGTVGLHVRDPHVTHSWGVCPLYALTGIYCPACGGLRGVNDLGNGHLEQAASSNLLMVLAIPFALVFFARWSYAAWSGSEMRVFPVLSRPVRIGLWTLLVAFTVARNLPGSWLAP
ncbi:MAG TPA: DUF2752 domain-containing protein [Nocardioides sp.]|uniref:DUF2752 domain-containing protein n=1 Tax=Nocardioides sp. TaxID=35761 RepID=UPI002F40BC1F